MLKTKTPRYPIKDGLTSGQVAPRFGFNSPGGGQMPSLKILTANFLKHFQGFFSGRKPSGSQDFVRVIWWSLAFLL
jgi:hypothetical protein